MGIWKECDNNSKLYIGDLPSDTSEQNLKTFLFKEGIRGMFSLTLKKGYAFMQCCNQAMADLVIDRIHGLTYNGNIIKVEPALSTFVGASTKNRHCLVTLISTQKNNHNATVSLEDIDKILEKWGGSFLSLEKQNSNTFLITVTDLKTTNDLIAGCHGMSLNGFMVTIKLVPELFEIEGAQNNGTNVMELRSHQIPKETSNGQAEGEIRTMSGFPNKFRGPPRNMMHDGYGYYAQNRGSYRGWISESIPQFPWRMLIPASLVGALIGRNGATIRGITESTGTRINIHTGNSRNYDVEKVVSIFGLPESISSACRKVLDVLVQDLSQTSGELSLRLMANNSLIGRVIGKAGSNITSVMNETQTKIHISNIQEMPRNLIKHMECDRIITIRGSVVGMCHAEAKLSAKLRTSHESDMQQFSSKRLSSY